MVDATTILLGFIFILIIALIITSFFYLNRDRVPVALVTTFGLTIKNVNNDLYISMENVSLEDPANPISGDVDLFPIMSLKPIVPGQSPEPTEGWILDPIVNKIEGLNLVTFLNPSNSGYITYDVNPDGTTLTGGFIRTDLATRPPDPTSNNITSFKGWFDMNQIVSNNITITTFRSLYPGKIGGTTGTDQYLIPGSENSPGLPNNPNVQPVTIGPASNGNNNWIVGSG